jgi:hypothetical protein
MKPKAKPRAKRPLSAEKLREREAIFAIYRDFGPGRTYERLVELARPQYGPISKRTLVNWSQQHNWRVRIDEHDRDLAATSQAAVDTSDGNAENQLLHSAAAALQTLMRSNPVVRTARDAKMLVDAVEKAIKLDAILKSKLSAPREAQKSTHEVLVKMMDAVENWSRLAKIAAQRAGCKIVNYELVPEDDDAVIKPPDWPAAAE